MNRRKFLAFLGASGVIQALSTAKVAQAAPHSFAYYPDSVGVLHDTVRCIGCRRCEAACQKVNNLPMPKIPFSDLSVTEKRRRTTAYEWTVVNKYEVNGKPFYRKLQCFHCNDPACAAACFAKCFKKLPNGAVVYDGSQCVGCRYCMVACPFNVPGFQYDLAWDPLVQKCTFCEPRLEQGLLPGCVEACPMDALTFGKRSDLIKIARSRMKANPGMYVDYVYGETDAGGTAWMVLAPAAGSKPIAPDEPVLAQNEMEQLGLDTHLGNQPMAEYTYGALGAVPMIVAFWPVLFGGAYAITKRREAANEVEKEKAVQEAKEQLMAEFAKNSQASNTGNEDANKIANNETDKSSQLESDNATSEGENK